MRHGDKRQVDFASFHADWPAVSIVILVYKTDRFIGECLSSLRALDYPGACEVIVVDNDEERFPLRETLEGHLRGETLVVNARNRGFAGGCNDGVARSGGEVVVFLNDDTRVRPDWLTEIVRPLRRDPRVAVVGCKMYFPGTRVLQHAGGILHANGMTQHIGYEEEDTGQYDEERDMPFLTGAGLAVRRAFLDLCGGGLDEDYYPAYCEELDLCFRARRMGYRVLYAPRATMEHHESPGLENQSPIFQRLVNRGRIIFCLKNYGPRDWLGFARYEWHWLRAPWSKGRRKKQLRAYLDGLLFLLGKRYSAERPFPGV